MSQLILDFRQPVAPSPSPVCQRWRHRRAAYRPANEPLDPNLYGVEPIADAQAKSFVTAHHYSGTYPAARTRIGLFRSRPNHAAELVGVAIFSVPMNSAAVTHHTGQPAAAAAGIDLGRFVLLDEEPANTESWFLARALRILHSLLPDISAVLSYSDPLPRHAIDGATTMPGHIGTIYQASNARYLGRSRARTLIVDVTGRTVSERALSKLRADDRGADYAYSQLLAAGAPPRHLGEPPPTTSTAP